MNKKYLRGRFYRILILDGFSSQGLPLMRSYYKAGHHVAVACPHRICAGYFSRYSNRRIIWECLYKNESVTLVKLIEYLESNETDLVLGLSDKTARLLSQNQALLEPLTHTIVPGYDTFKIAANKLNTMNFCMENNIPCPFTLDGDTVDPGKIEELIQFPIIVKPKKGVGSLGVFKYTDPVLLKDDISWIRDKFGSVLIQEYIPNEEQYTVEAFCDSHSTVSTCVVIEKSRFYPVSGGTSSCNLTRIRPEVESLVVSFLEKLGWIGSANLDVIYDPRDHTPKIIEINPRVGAMVRVAFEAGVDIAGMQLQLAFEPGVERVMQYQEGIVLRNLLLDIPWLLSGSLKEKGKIKPSFFRFFGKEVYYQTLRKDDPLASLGFLFGNLGKYLNPVNFKKKFFKQKRIQAEGKLIP